MLNTLGISIDMRTLTPYSRLARSYERTPSWLRWLRPRARDEFYRCRAQRRRELIDAVIEQLEQGMPTMRRMT